VTVQPLTRGTGNHGGPTVSSTSGGRGRGPIEIHLHNEVVGREFQRVVKKVALEDFGLQI
jgi:hypothetical protein